MKLQSGHTIVPVEGTEMKNQEEDFEAYGNGLIRLMPGRWLFPSHYQEFADRLYNFKFKESDVLVMTYPKCGTTWTQEVVWTMRNNPNLDSEDANLHVMLRAPFIEIDAIKPRSKHGDGPSGPSNPAFLEAFKKMCPGKDPADGVNIQIAECSPDPRTIKTHLPFSMLSPSLLDTTKVVYIARNPKDVIISYHHHSRILKFHNYVGNFEDFVQYFVDDDLMYGPYWLSLKEAWEKKDHPNLHFIFYEDMKANPMDEFKKLDAFMGTNLTEAQLEGIIKYTSFAEMKTRASKSIMDAAFNMEVVNKDGGFFRKGESGDWKGKLTPELEAKVDQWIQKNLSSLGIDFKYSV